jgi:hypothetical protein
MGDTPQNAYNAGYGWLAESGQQAMDYTSQNDVYNFPRNKAYWFAGLNEARSKSGLPPVAQGGRLRKSRKSRKTRKTKRRKSYRRRY